MRNRKIDYSKLLKLIEEGIPQQDIAKHFGVTASAICQASKRLHSPPASLDRLTSKEKRFCIEVANGSTRTKAALNSFDCGSLASAKAIQNQLMAKPEINMAITDLMEEAGVTKRYRVGKIKSFIESRDPNIALKALDMTGKLTGGYAPERHVYANYSIRDYAEYFQAKREELERQLLELATEDSKENKPD